MSMRALILKQVQNAIIQLGDIPVECDYLYHTGNDVRDVEAGVTIPEVRVYRTPRVVKARFTSKEVKRYGDGLNAYTDMKMIIARLDLDAAVNDPSPVDEIREVKTGKVWQVKKLLSDPADAALIYQVQAV